MTHTSTKAIFTASSINLLLALLAISSIGATAMVGPPKLTLAVEPEAVSKAIGKDFSGENCQKKSNNNKNDDSSDETATFATQHRDHCLDEKISIYERQYTLPYHERKKRLLVYSCRKPPCGGVGDRLNGILSLFYIAIATERVLFIDWTYPDDLHKYLSPNKIHWNISTLMRDKIRSSMLYDFHNRGEAGMSAIHNIANSDTEIIVTSYNHFYPSDVYRMLCPQSSQPANAYGIPVELKAAALHSLFSRSASLQHHIETRKSKLKLNTSYVGLHFRAGGLQQLFVDSEVRHGANTIEMFANCAKFCLWTQNFSQVFVASDSVNAKKKLAEIIPGVSTSNDPAHHLDKTPLHAQGEENQLFMWTDFFLLVDSTCLIRSRSWFSDLAYDWGHVLGSKHCSVRGLSDSCKGYNILAKVKTGPPISFNVETRIFGIENLSDQKIELNSHLISDQIQIFDHALHRKIPNLLVKVAEGSVEAYSLNIKHVPEAVSAQLSVLMLAPTTGEPHNQASGSPLPCESASPDFITGSVMLSGRRVEYLGVVNMTSSVVCTIVLSLPNSGYKRLLVRREFANLRKCFFFTVLASNHQIRAFYDLRKEMNQFS